MNRDDWNRRYEGKEFVWSAQPNRFLVAEAAMLPPGRAIDLGCGEGRNTVWLAEQGWQATGVDFSDVALEKARQLAERRSVTAKWVQADLLDYQPPAAAFDLVILFYLQMPGQELERILPRAAAAVAPAGTLLLVGHDSGNLHHGYGGPQDPTVLYTAADITPHLAGLEIERAEQTTRTVETDQGTRDALDVLVRARRPGT